jgi:outer membrane receptor protein involved in Fe transport
MRIKSVVFAVLTVLAMVGIGVAQSSKGILAGTVRDSTGAVISNAKVTITSQDTGETRTLMTSSLGSYRVDAINPGPYQIHVEMTGFAAADVKDLSVVASTVTTYDPVLAVGAVSNAVTVEANSNGINTENGQLSGTIDATELNKVPIFSLNPFELVATLPGAQMMNPSLNLGGVGGNFEQLSINGARPRSNNYMLDGQDINDVGIGGQSFDPQVPDMYQSTTALLNSASAEYGRSGGAVVNLITKSGTNQYHGTLAYLYQGSGLNALDGVTRQGKPFPAGTPNPKARFDIQQLGFTAGGPLWKNKLFAFGGTQFSRFYGTSPSGSITLPDATGYAELTSIANTSTTAKTQVALLQGLLNSGSYLTSYQALPGGNGSLKVSPANCPGGVACSVSYGLFQRPPVPQQEPDTQWMVRIDYIPREKDTVTFRYLHDRENFTPDLGLNTSGLPGFDGQVGGPTELAQLTWTHVFTANLLNEFRISEVRLNTQFAPTPQTLANPLAKTFNITFNGTPLPTLGVSQNIPQGRKQDLYQFQDAVSYSKGRQTFRLGVDVGRDLETDLVAQNALGGITFNSGGGASPLDNFLFNQLGTSGSATKAFGPTRVDPHLWKLAAFVQDDIKLLPELTINLGIRYDYDTNPENALPYPAIDINNPFGPINAVIPVKADKNNFGPRFGFAFNPHGGIFARGTTVFHGGIGIFYDTDFTNILINGAQSAPNVVSGTATSTAVGGLANATGQLALLTPVLTAQSSVESTTNNMVNPLTYQYNFGIEQELPAAIKLTVNYVGAHSEKLFSNRQLNYFQGPNLPRINSSRGVIDIRDNRADSNYNSGQVDVSRRFAHGLFFRAVYTYGKNLDDASEVFATFASPTSYSANLAGNGLGQDWGNSVWNRTHIASFEYVYSPVGFRSANRIFDTMLSAFTRNFYISGTTQVASGPYSTFNFSGIDSNGDGSAANDRPLVGNPKLPIGTVGIDGSYVGGTPGVYYDLVANNSSSTTNILNPVTASQAHFLIPGGPTAQKGVGRNSFENPGQSFWNVALEKDVPTPFFHHLENARLAFRAECQNVGNHNNVSPLFNNLLYVGTPTFLNVSAAREGTFQSFRLWGKFVF